MHHAVRRRALLPALGLLAALLCTVPVWHGWMVDQDDRPSSGVSDT